jgi:hypothetical protein
MQFNQAGDPSDDENLPLEDFFLPSEFAQEAHDPTSGPEASSQQAPPTDGTTSGEALGSDGEPALPEFDPRHREAFDGLLFLGALDTEFVWAGHRFKIRTLTTGELLEVALAQRQYRDSLGDSRSYVTAIAAACIVHVDGKPLPQPLSTQVSDTEFSNKFAYVRDSWFPWVTDTVYGEYMKLEAQATEVLEAMGKASPSAASTRG